MVVKNIDFVDMLIAGTWVDTNNKTASPYINAYRSVKKHDLTSATKTNYEKLVDAEFNKQFKDVGVQIVTDMKTMNVAFYFDTKQQHTMFLLKWS